MAGLSVGWILGRMGKRAVGRSQSMHQLLMASHRRMSLADLRERTLHCLRDEIGASGVVVWMAGESELTQVAVIGAVPALESLPRQAGISGQALANGQSLDLTLKGQSEMAAEEFTAMPARVIAIPIPSHATNSEEPLGVLTAVFDRPASTPDALGIAQAYAAILALAIQSEGQVASMRANVVQCLEEIADHLDAKDERNRQHSRRTAHLAGLIGRRMGLSDPTLSELTLGARLADLGKVALPESIVGKTTPLTLEEIDVIKKHPLVSYEIGSLLRLPTSVLLLMRNHHERLDGTGYPDGLRGGELPLSLRILCVADAYCAMTRSRADRPAMTPREAVANLSADSAKFDTDVVQALGEIVQSQQVNELVSGVEEVRWAA